MLQNDKIQTEVTANDTVSKLKSEAKKNPVFNAVAYSFAMRERSRRQVTVNNLALIMKREGFNYSRKELQEVLKFLGSLQLGKLEKTPRGNVRVLKGIPVTLQSIGLSALGKENMPEVRTTHKQVTSAPPHIKTAINEQKDSIKIEYGSMTLYVRDFPESKLKDLIQAIEAITR